MGSKLRNGRHPAVGKFRLCSNITYLFAEEKTHSQLWELEMSFCMQVVSRMPAMVGLKEARLVLDLSISAFTTLLQILYV